MSSRSGVALVEHLVVRQGGAYRLTPSAEVPEVVLQLLTDARLVPGEIAGCSSERVAEEGVSRLVARLLSSERQLPMVLVSVENGTRQPTVDPAELARRLAGMASVHFIDAVRSSHRLKEDLIGAGFSEKFGCYNGGVRILWPGIVAGDDPYAHTLLLPMRLFAMPEQVRTEQTAGLFCEMIAEDEDPRASGGEGRDEDVGPVTGTTPAAGDVTTSRLAGRDELPCKPGAGPRVSPRGPRRHAARLAELRAVHHRTLPRC
jgi:hypothetical protein